MRYVALYALITLASVTWAQDDDTGKNRRLGSNNPFARDVNAGGDANPFQPSRQLGETGMEMDMDFDMEMGMDMGMGGMPSRPSPEQLFRNGLQRAISALRKANKDDEKETLQRHIREAFEKRYDTMIAERKKDIARLKQSVANLEAEMQRRAAAKDRVVQLQLQSVQLAAEGILEPDELLPRANNPASDDPFGF